jgi:magnesium transporter
MTPESLRFVSKKSGLAPGTLVHVGTVHEHPHSVTVTNYNQHILEKCTINSIEELLHYKTTDTVTWVMIEGLQEVAIIDAIGRHFDIHPLILEDILNTHQRTKFEEYPDYLYFVLKVVSLGAGVFNVEYEQISILVLKILFLPLWKNQMDYLSQF